MGHICKYTCEAKVKYNKIIFEVTAHWKDRHEIVYIEDEKGNCKSRYIYQSYCIGYLVAFPNEKISNYNYYYGYSIQEECGFEKSCKLSLYPEWKTYEKDLEEIATKIPKYKYLINKMKNNPDCKYMDKFLKILKKYKENSEIENLIALGYTNLALDKRLAKITKDKKSKIINYLKNKKVPKDVTLQEIFQYLKYPNEAVLDREIFKQTKYDLKTANYICKQISNGNNINVYYYYDYKRMCEYLNKNFNDDYWRYPKNLVEKHNQVLEEYNNQIEFMNTVAGKQQQLDKVITEKLKKNNCEIDNYEIYLANNMQDIKNQAEKLHQCLITANYTKKIINRKSLLVFIKKKDKPVATAEIDYKKNILQFYGDEIDHCNCTPSGKVKKAFNQWLSQAKIRKEKRI